jgi:hypothetical protein
MNYSSFPGLVGPSGANGNQGAQGQTGPSGPPGSSPNGLLNAEMQIAQRGVGGSATFTITTSQYCLDRWFAYTNLSGGTGQTAVISQVPGAKQGQFLQQVQRLSGSSNGNGIGITQTLTRNASIPFSGNTVTLSFSALAGANFSAANSQIYVYLVYNTLSTDGGMVAGQTNYTGSTTLSTMITLTPTLARYNTSFNVPATATQVCVYFAYVPTGTAGTADYFQITDTRLEVGSAATPIVRQRFEQALADCLPYYEKSYPYNVAPKTNNSSGFVSHPGTNGGVNGVTFGWTPFQAIKRIAPTVTTFSLLNSYPGAASYYSSGTTLADSGAGNGNNMPGGITQSGFQNYNQSGGTIGVNIIFGHHTADAELN